MPVKSINNYDDIYKGYTAIKTKKYDVMINRFIDFKSIIFLVNDYTLILVYTQKFAFFFTK